jgi:hypothetical protein
MPGSSSDGGIVLTNPDKTEAKRLLVVLTEGNKKTTNLLAQIKTLKARAAVSKSGDRALYALSDKYL